MTETTQRHARYIGTEVYLSDNGIRVCIHGKPPENEFRSPIWAGTITDAQRLVGLLQEAIREAVYLEHAAEALENAAEPPVLEFVPGDRPTANEMVAQSPETGECWVITEQYDGTFNLWRLNANRVVIFSRTGYASQAAAMGAATKAELARLAEESSHGQ